MPWWFWIITHVWVICSTLIIIFQIENDHYQGEDWAWKLLLGLMCLLGPISVIVGLLGAIWEEKNIWSKIKDKIKDKWILRKLGQFSRYIVNFRKRRQDFKECDDNEDEWRIERLGIK